MPTEREFDLKSAEVKAITNGIFNLFERTDVPPMEGLAALATTFGIAIAEALISKRLTRIGAMSLFDLALAALEARVKENKE